MESSLDLLTSMLQTMRVKSLISSVSHTAGPWQRTFKAEENWGFHLVTSGHCVLEVGERQVPLGPGDWVLPGAAHTLSQPAQGQHTALICGAYAFAEMPFWRSAMPQFLHVPAGQMPLAMCALVDALTWEVAEERPGGASARAQLTDALLIYGIRHWLDHTQGQQRGWLGALSHPALSTLLWHFHQDPGHPWTLEAAARAAGMSRASLSRHFSHAVGGSPMAYLARLRMDIAHKRWMTGAYTLDQIAQDVGYATPFALSKAFKRTFGHSPAQARHLSQGAAE